jgi:hypothetical protein
MVTATIREMPFHRTMPLQIAITILTFSDISDLTWGGGAAAAVAWLAASMRDLEILPLKNSLRCEC